LAFSKSYKLFSFFMESAFSLCGTIFSQLNAVGIVAFVLFRRIVFSFAAGANQSYIFTHFSILRIGFFFPVSLFIRLLPEKRYQILTKKGGKGFLFFAVSPRKTIIQ